MFKKKQTYFILLILFDIYLLQKNKYLYSFKLKFISNMKYQWLMINYLFHLKIYL